MTLADLVAGNIDRSLAGDLLASDLTANGGVAASARSCRAAGIGAVAIVGTAKNVGKTVTMNYLARELAQRGITIGLVSSGRDGETSDSFTGEPKPSVVPPEGSWVATAEGVLGESASLMEMADVSDRPGLLGRLVLGKVRESAPVELVGPGNVRGLGRVVRRLCELGADLVLVDGALDRIAAASPSVTDAVILAAGAESASSLAAIASRVEFLTWLWSRSRPEDPQARALAAQVVERGRVAFIDITELRKSDAAAPKRVTARDAIGMSAGSLSPSTVSSRDTVSGTNSAAGVSPTRAYALRETPYRSCLGREDEILSKAKDARWVVVPGAVSDKFLKEAASLIEDRDFGVIAPSAVNVFAAGDAGVDIRVVDEMRLLAVTVNPVSYRGASYDPRDMVDAVAGGARRGCGRDVPTFDVVSGVSRERGVDGVAMG